MKILLFGLALLVFGLFAIYSVSIFESFDLTLKFVEKGLREDPSNYYYFFEQLLKFGVGLVLALIAWFTPLRVIRKWKYLIFGATCILLLLLFTPLGEVYNGAKGWLIIGGQSIQPAEFFKIGFVLFLSSWLLRKRRVMEDRAFFVGFVIVVSVVCSIFLFIPDLGTLLVIGAVSLIMFWYAGGKAKYIFFTMALGLAAGALAATQFGYIQERVSYFISPESDTTGRGIGRQTRQALIAVGGGGRVGKGYGKGLQKFGYIPEAQSDFIFAALAEEIGFVGNSILLALYFLLAYHFLIKLPKVKDDYDRIVGVGLISMIIMQVFINIGVNIKLVPLTGLTLPFVSHGGSALIVNMIELVLLQKIILEK